MRLYKALNRLQHYAYPERQQKHAIEETAEELSALPPERKGLRYRVAFRDLRGETGLAWMSRECRSREAYYQSS